MCIHEDGRSFCAEHLNDFEEINGRREFLRSVAGTAAGLAALGGVATTARAEETKAESKSKPAEGLIRELHATLDNDQKSQLVLPWDHGKKQGSSPTRHKMFNRPFANQRIEDNYTKPQQELIERILRSICSGDDGFRQLSKDGKWDSSKSLLGCGSHIFGDPSGDGKFAWVFTGHHLTVRCDGNSEVGAAFGGPLYYGNLPNGYSNRNVFFYQTKRVMEVFDALNKDQRTAAIASGTPGERAPSIRFRPKTEKHPGLAFAEMEGDQKTLVEQVMRDVLSPYRKEDVDEVMQIVKANGGMDKIHLAFYEDAKMRDGQPWHFWRLEGPGFVWNYRVLPHVHCYVNIAKIA